MGVITIVTGLANHSNSSNHLLNSTILQAWVTDFEVQGVPFRVRMSGLRPKGCRGVLASACKVVFSKGG